MSGFRETIPNHTIDFMRKLIIKIEHADETHTKDGPFHCI